MAGSVALLPETEISQLPIEQRLEGFESEIEEAQFVQAYQKNSEHLESYGLVDPDIIDPLIQRVIRKKVQPNPDIPIVAAWDDGEGALEIYDGITSLDYAISHERGHIITEAGLIYDPTVLNLFEQAALGESDAYEQLPSELQYIIDSLNDPAKSSRECKYLAEQIQHIHDPDKITKRYQDFIERHPAYRHITLEQYQTWLKRDAAKEILNERVAAYLLSDGTPEGYFSQVRKEMIHEYIDPQVWQEFDDLCKKNDPDSKAKAEELVRKNPDLAEYFAVHRQTFQKIRQSLAERDPQELNKLVQNHLQQRGNKQVGYGVGYYPEEPLTFDKPEHYSLQGPSLIDIFFKILCS